MNASPQSSSDEERLGWVAEQVDVWRGLTTASPPIEPGSSLDEDGKGFPLLPVSDLAWWGIVHAITHLDAFMFPLMAEHPVHFPLSPQTLGRSSVLGAAHALWLLDAPERRERQRRALRLAYTEFTSERTALREIEQISGVASGMSASIETTTEWAERAVKVGISLGFEENKITQRIDDTEIIDSVAKRYVATSAPQVGVLVNAYRVLWRTQSGIAHGYRWPNTMSGVAVTSESNDVTVVSETADIVMAASAAAILIQRAIQLYEQAARATS